MATHSSLLAWRIPWTEEPGGLQSMGSRRVRHNWSDWAHTQRRPMRTWCLQKFLHEVRRKRVYTAYSCRWISAGDWSQKTPQIPKSASAQAINIKWCRTVALHICGFWIRGCRASGYKGYCTTVGCQLEHLLFSTQACLTTCDSVDCSPAGNSVHRILQARILEWVATSFSRGSFWPRSWTCVSCTGRQILYHRATKEVRYWGSERKYSSDIPFSYRFPFLPLPQSQQFPPPPDLPQCLYIFFPCTKSLRSPN